MVLIAAPASRVVPDPVTSADAAELAAGGQAAGVGLAAQLAGVVGRHAVVWSACGAVLVVAGSLAVSLLASGDEQVAARSHQVLAVAEPTAEHESTRPQTTIDVDDSRYSSIPVAEQDIATSETVATLPPLPVLPMNKVATSDEIQDVVAVNNRPIELATPVATSEPASPADDRHENGRTLRLDPLAIEPSRASLGDLMERVATEAAGDYSGTPDEDQNRQRLAQTAAADVPIHVSAKPQVAGPPRRAVEPVDVAAQLSVKLAAIDVPETTLAEFLRMVSDMAAVPIKLDPAAGVSPRTKVSVRAQNVTLANLLDEVLAEHGLAREERDGPVILVRPKLD